jgi:hypothetical protein
MFYDLGAADIEARRRTKQPADARQPPYLKFANCTTDTESIMKYTEAYGVLIFSPAWPGPEWIFGLRPDIRIDSSRFELPVDEWRSLHRDFRQLIELGRSRSRTKLMKFIEMLRKVHDNTTWSAGHVSPEVIETTEWDRSRNRITGVQVLLSASTPWGAYLWMLARDVERAAEVSIGTCKDPNCRNYFLRSDPRREYCDNVCRHRHNGRLYERRKARKLHREPRKGIVGSQLDTEKEA